MVERDTWSAQSAWPARAARVLALVAEPIPRAGILAAWCNAWFAGACAGDDVIDAMVPFGSQVIIDADGSRQPLLVGLSELRRLGVGGFRIVLPVPGDAAGLPGPESFNTAAVAVGQAMTDDEAGFGLIPQVDESMTAWAVYRTTPRFRQAPPLRSEEASQAIRQAMQRATTELESLDACRDRKALGERLHQLETDLGQFALPRSMPPAAIHTARSAAQILGILAIASEDDGATVTAAQAAMRVEVMAELAATARHALAAAASTR